VFASAHLQCTAVVTEQWHYCGGCRINISIQGQHAHVKKLAVLHVPLEINYHLEDKDALRLMPSEGALAAGTQHTKHQLHSAQLSCGRQSRPRSWRDACIRKLATTAFIETQQQKRILN
jgi:hypothetical protein